MLKSLSIQNFQSHKESKFEFHPGVNIIIGNTDSGKSAIIRAVRFVKDNRPTGTSIRSNWGGETSVEIENENGIICRSKDKIETYTIRTGRRKLVLKAFGTSVPAEVVKFLNLNELNIQYQLDSHFLLSKSSGEVASHFNKVANLSKIDTATSNINSWISKIESNITLNNDFIKKNEEKLKQFDNIEKLETEIEVLEELEERKKNLQSKASKLYSKIVTYQNINDEIVVYKDTLKLEEPINNISSLYSEKKTLYLQLVKLNNLIKIFDSNENKINDKLTLIEAENLIKQILEFYNEKNTLNLQNQKLYKALNDYKSIGILINEYEQKHDSLLQLYEKEYPDICVFCGQLVEKWKPIKNYEGLYDVSNYGRIRTYYDENTRKISNIPKIKEQITDEDGYKKILLYANHKGFIPKNIQIHRLVLETFIGPCPKNMKASHLDGDRTNNRLNNLKWETHHENEQRKTESGNSHLS